ncbi:MAG: glycoside hydrolase family 2 protein [Anaerorhabdus sp.]
MLKRYNLNYGWDYATEIAYKKDEWIKVNIPHTNLEIPYNYVNEKSYQFKSYYKKKIMIDKDYSDKRYLLKFDGVMLEAEVFVNDKLVGSHKGGYTPFCFDITEFINFSIENDVLVCVDSNENPNIAPFGFVVDYLTYGGMYREVFLDVVDNLYIENCHLIFKDTKSKQKKINMDLFLTNINNYDKCNLEMSIEKDGELIRKFTKDIEIDQAINSRKTLEFTLEDDVLLWNLNSPVLYDFKISIKTSDSEDTKLIRTGFREVEFKDDGFYLNGSKIKLRGLNRHQSFPYVGYAMPKNAQEKDADILKYDLGLNVVRSSHYPPSDHFLNRCDEIGLLVFDEIPGWQYVSQRDGEWCDNTLIQVEEMIKKDFNHPSVFIWGVRINESQDCDELYKKTNLLAKSLDSSRPTGGVRCFAGSKLLEDVYTYNDFIYNGGKVILDKRKKIAKSKVPYLVTEYNGHMFPTKRHDSQGRRVEHSLRHLNVINRMMGDNEISGAIGWCMNDYNTHKEFGSGDKICYHGVLDMYRNFKYAGYVYQAEGSEYPVMEIASTLDNGDVDESIRGDVYIYTNCDFVRMYVNDVYIKEFYPNKVLFPNLNHPPIVIDDFIGDAIEKNERFSKKDAKTIKKILMKVDKKGLDLPITDLFKIGRLYLKYKMNIQDASALYTKYFGGWGSSSTTYRFEGYKDGQRILVKNKSQVFNPSLILKIDSDVLVEDETYETVRCSVECVDENGELCQYSNEVISVEVNDKLELIGPSNLALTAGTISFWVKTNGSIGDGKITVKSVRFNEVSQNLTVNKINQKNIL